MGAPAARTVPGARGPDVSGGRGVAIGGERARAAAREGDAGRPTGIRQKTKLADAHEAARQDVLDEATEKLHRRERHRAPLPVVRIVLPPKGHALAVEGEQPMIADRDAMGIASEVPQDGGRPRRRPVSRRRPSPSRRGRRRSACHAAGSRRCSLPPARSSSFWS